MTADIFYGDTGMTEYTIDNVKGTDRHDSLTEKTFDEESGLTNGTIGKVAGAEDLRLAEFTSSGNDMGMEHNGGITEGNLEAWRLAQARLAQAAGTASNEMNEGMQHDNLMEHPTDGLMVQHGDLMNDPDTVETAENFANTLISEDVLVVLADDGMAYHDHEEDLAEQQASAKQKYQATLTAMRYLNEKETEQKGSCGPSLAATTEVLFLFGTREAGQSNKRACHAQLGKAVDDFSNDRPPTDTPVQPNVPHEPDYLIPQGDITRRRPR